MMNDQTQNDPEERAFGGHPDHPPQEPDQQAQKNQDLLRKDEGSGGGAPESDPGEGKSPGDQGTNLPGYG